MKNIRPTLKVMGARTQVGSEWANLERKLVALDRDTLRPVVVDWSYEDTPDIITTTDIFTDTKPTKRLLAASSTYNRGNLINHSHIGGSPERFAAIDNSGKVVAWGYSDDGKDSPTSPRNHDVNSIYAAGKSSIALNNNKQIFVWGRASDEPIPEEVASLTDIVMVKGYGDNVQNFLVLRENNQVMQWQDEGAQWPLPQYIAEMDDIISIEASGYAFAALRKDGHVVAWGDPKYGGEIPESIKNISDVIKIYANYRCFVALREGGNIVTWGSELETDIPENISILNDIISIYPYYGGFLGLRKNNSIVTSGNPRLVDEIPDRIASRNDFIDIQVSVDQCIAVLLPGGKIDSWGKWARNPNYVQMPENVTDVVSLCGGQETMAALKKDGSVIAWGHQKEGSHTETVKDQLYNIRAIYSSLSGFCALREDNTVVVWGECCDVPPELQGNITYSYE